MGSRGVIEENDLSEPRGGEEGREQEEEEEGGYIHARAFAHARTHAATAPRINSRRVLRRLCVFMSAYAPPAGAYCGES